jgi:hypothetical protein
MLQETLGSKYEISIFKSNAPLANVVEDLGNLSKDVSKQDHVVVVERPGNSLDRNCHYSIDRDLELIAERMNNTNVGFANLFMGHNKLWMNRIRNMNLRLDRP